MADRGQEFEDLLERIAYEVTTARATGLGDHDKLRSVVKKIRDLASELDALSVTVTAERSER